MRFVQLGRNQDAKDLCRCYLEDPEEPTVEKEDSEDNEGGKDNGDEGRGDEGGSLSPTGRAALFSAETKAQRRKVPRPRPTEPFDFNCVIPSGRDAVHIAARNGNIEMLEWLYQVRTELLSAEGLTEGVDATDGVCEGTERSNKTRPPDFHVGAISQNDRFS